MKKMLIFSMVSGVMLCLWCKIYEGHKNPSDAASTGDAILIAGANRVNTVDYKIDSAVLYRFNDGVIIEDRRAIPHKYLVIEGPSENTDSAGLHEEGFFISRHDGGLTTFAVDEKKYSYCQLNEQGGYDIGFPILDQEVLDPYLRGDDLEKSIRDLLPRRL